VSKNKIRKTISLNITNEKDIPLIERIESVPNFNEYIKRLIEKDIKSRKIIKTECKTNQPLGRDTEIKADSAIVIK
jgi:hypothetical protein